LSGTLQGAGGIGGLLARSDHSQPPSPYYSAHSYYHADGNGNVTMLINASQLMVAKYLYDPYGNTLSMSGSMAALNNYRFSSKEWNNNAGYYYYGRRFYDPNLQRWVNRDPLGEAGGINLYGPVANNPVNAIDIFGFRTCYPVLVVTLYGKQYLPETTVKNSDQASLIPYFPNKLHKLMLLTYNKAA
jgi:RHS repeat-associated protein